MHRGSPALRNFNGSVADCLLMLESFNSRKIVKETCTINVEFLYIVVILG